MSRNADMLHLVKSVFKSLQDHDVRYVTIGGIAAILHGVPRPTFDLDILIEATTENAQRALDALKECGMGTAYLTTAEDVAASAGTIFKDYVRVDVLTRVPGLTFEDAWAGKMQVEFEGQPFYIANRDHIIASKTASARDVDLEDVRMLKAIEGQEGG